jgi:hypothetical protein
VRCQFTPTRRTNFSLFLSLCLSLSLSGSTGDWAQALHLLGNSSIVLIIPQLFFALVIFFDWVLCFLSRTGHGPWSSYLRLLCTWDYRNVAPCLVFSWDEASLTSCLGWPWTMFLLISISWRTGIRDVYHHVQTKMTKILKVENTKYYQRYGTGAPPPSLQDSKIIQQIWRAFNSFLECSI